LIFFNIEPLEDRETRQKELAAAAAERAGLETDPKYERPSVNDTLSRFP